MTLINVFSVKPEKQQALVDLLVEATDRTMKRQPGFVSASIHRSLDGTKAAAALAIFDPIVCEVAESVGDDE